MPQIDLVISVELICSTVLLQYVSLISYSFVLPGFFSHEVCNVKVLCLNLIKY